MNRMIRAAYKRLGIIHLGRRRVRDLIDFIEDREIDVVMDVGANVGQFGESLRDGGYRGRIVSFEPIEAPFQTLSRKAAADGNWEAHHCGLGAVSGTAALNVSELSVFSSILGMTPPRACTIAEWRWTTLRKFGFGPSMKLRPDCRGGSF